MFFRPAIALSGAFHRLKRQELSEVTQLFPRRKRLLLRGLRPRHGCAPRSDKTASCPLNVSPPRALRFSPSLRSRFIPAATDAPHDPSSASRLSRPRHFCPPLLSSTRVFSCISPAVLRPSRSSLQTRRHEDRSPVSSFTRHGLCIPPFPLAPHESSYPKQKMPSGSAFPRRLVFPSLPCVCVPRLPSPAPHLLCIPGEAPATPACPRPAASPYHTQKARLHEADGPLHCKKAPIRNQACIPG